MALPFQTCGPVDQNSRGDGPHLRLRKISVVSAGRMNCKTAMLSQTTKTSGIRGLIDTTLIP